LPDCLDQSSRQALRVIGMRKTLHLQKQTIRRLSNAELTVARPRGGDYDNGTASHFAVCITYYSYCTDDSSWCSYGRYC
jgi:hypothetical protein